MVTEIRTDFATSYFTRSMPVSIVFMFRQIQEWWECIRAASREMANSAAALQANKKRQHGKILLIPKVESGLTY
jgi:hypothetical protein